MRTAIGLFHLFHSFSVHLEYSLYILIVSSVSVTEKKTCPQKNLRGFCAVYVFQSGFRGLAVMNDYSCDVYVSNRGLS